MQRGGAEQPAGEQAAKLTHRERERKRMTEGKHGNRLQVLFLPLCQWKDGCMLGQNAGCCTEHFDFFQFSCSVVKNSKREVKGFQNDLIPLRK